MAVGTAAVVVTIESLVPPSPEPPGVSRQDPGHQLGASRAPDPGCGISQLLKPRNSARSEHVHSTSTDGGFGAANRTDDEWAVIEPADRAVELAERLHDDPGEGSLLFGRFAFEVRYCGSAPGSTPRPEPVWA